MILRSWRARASTAGATAYARHFRDTVLPTLGNVDGFLGGQLWSERNGDAVDLLVLTRWRSIDAVRAFAGDAYEEAVVASEAAATLIDYDKTVRHFDVVESSEP